MTTMTTSTTTKRNAKLRRVVEELKFNGFLVNINQYIDDNHRQCCWYNGVVATMENDKYVLVISSKSCPEFKFTLVDGLKDKTYSANKRTNFECLRQHFENDEELLKAVDDGRLLFDCDCYFTYSISSRKGAYDLCRGAVDDSLSYNILKCLDVNILKGLLTKHENDN